MNQCFVVANLSVEARTAPTAEQCGEYLQRRDVVVPNIGNMPCEMKVSMLERAFVDDFACSYLAGFIWQHNRGQGACGLTSVPVVDPSQNFVRIDRADDDEEAVVWGVAFTVVIEKIAVWIDTGAP